MSSNTRFDTCTGVAIKSAFVASALALVCTTGCSSKNYVRSQTAPIVQQTNQLDAKTATDHRNIVDTDERATKGIAGAQSAADTADQHAVAAGQAADTANSSAQDAYNRVDSLAGVVANLDNYKPVSDVSVNFAFDKYALTADTRRQLDDFAAKVANGRNFILAVTGGTDSIGDREYNYQLSQRRADAVVNYLSSKHNIAPRKFYLIGIGKDQEVASNSTSAGRAKNRRVEVQMMTNMSDQPATSASVASPNAKM